ncbi:uncharacterized protein [Battus philenor]|uniref:uncharacterized protein n=1 Tax=Battus philenor TaxID=42288 RepID=UPI0035CF2F12
MATIVKLFYLTMCFVIVICKPKMNINKSVSHVELKVRPLELKETNTIPQGSENSSIAKKPCSIKCQEGDKSLGLLGAMLTLLQNIGNSFPSLTSNSQMYAVLRILIYPKNINQTNFSTTKQPPELQSSTEKISTTTQYYDPDCDDDSTRPITLLDTKSEKFNIEKNNKILRKFPEVEHGSVQSSA